jgi:hypothetical protein
MIGSCGVFRGTNMFPFLFLQIRDLEWISHIEGLCCAKNGSLLLDADIDRGILIFNLLELARRR